MTMLTEERAREILLKHMHTPRMIRHSIAVSEGMKVMARRLGEDEALWGAVGLIHDVDYEFEPSKHCSHVGELLAPEGICDELIHSIATHGYFKYPGTPVPYTLLERCLYAIDRVSWIAVAAAYRMDDKGVSLNKDDVLTLLYSDKLGERFSRAYILAACERADISHEFAAECLAEAIRSNTEKIAKAIL